MDFKQRLFIVLFREKESKKEEKEKLKAKEKAKAKEAKKLKALSFDPDEEEDFEEEDEVKEPVKTDNSKDEDTSPEFKKRRFGMNPDVDTAFLPDRDRDEEVGSVLLSYKQNSSLDLILGKHNEGEVEAAVGGEAEVNQGRRSGDNVQLLGWIWTQEEYHYEEGQLHLSVPVQGVGLHKI